MSKFTEIEYLKFGNKRQVLAYAALKRLKIFEILKDYQPILTGTIPIEIDIPNSDLDVICYVENQEKFIRLVSDNYGQKNDFEIKEKEDSETKIIFAKFRTRNFVIEIFGQNIPTQYQNAYRHMLIEYQLLQQKGENFKRKVKELKLLGLKTEPAFAKLLGLKGNPCKALLKYRMVK